MGKRLAAQLTAVTLSDVATALDSAWTKLLGTPPKRDALCVLLAQSALETGHWKHSYCYNLGNAKAGAAWQGDHCFYPADEIVNQAQAALAFAQRAPRTDGVAGHNVELTPLRGGQVQVTLHPDHPWCRFRAFTTLQAGADDYLGLLHSRFKAAWPALEAGDPAKFVRMLKEVNYFTTSVENYLPPVVQLFKKFSKELTAIPSTGATPVAGVAAAGSPSQATETTGLALPVPVGGRPTLQRGDRGPRVGEVQAILLRLGYQNLKPTSVFDEATLAAVELFQLQHVDERGLQLRSDGDIGAHTWWALLNPSGDAQRNHLPAPPSTGLTPLRSKLLVLLDNEHKKPVFESPDGSNRSRDIDRYWGNTGGVGNAWCCAFVSWALHETLGQFPIAGEHHVGVQKMWVAADHLQMATTSPKPGDVFIQIKSGGTGHTGFVVGVSQDGDTLYTCEGNCGNRLKYGQRRASTIHHFIDCIRDGQAADFPRGSNLKFDDVATDGTR